MDITEIFLFFIYIINKQIFKLFLQSWNVVDDQNGRSEDNVKQDQGSFK